MPINMALEAGYPLVGVFLCGLASKASIGKSPGDFLVGGLSRRRALGCGRVIGWFVPGGRGGPLGHPCLPFGVGPLLVANRAAAAISSATPITLALRGGLSVGFVRLAPSLQAEIPVAIVTEVHACHGPRRRAGSVVPE